jgi:hypothetical protein
MGTGSFPGVKSGRGMTLTPHPLLVPWSWKSRAVPLHPLWAVRPVQSLSACTMVHFTFLSRFVNVHVISIAGTQSKSYSLVWSEHLCLFIDLPSLPLCLKQSYYVNGLTGYCIGSGILISGCSVLSGAAVTVAINCVCLLCVNCSAALM